jgi:hypothetical protein
MCDDRKQSARSGVPFRAGRCRECLHGRQQVNHGGVDFHDVRCDVEEPSDLDWVKGPVFEKRLQVHGAGMAAARM